jgi:hypothetical protein
VSFGHLRTRESSLQQIGLPPLHELAARLGKPRLGVRPMRVVVSVPWGRRIAGLSEGERAGWMRGAVGTGSRTMADLIGLAAARHGVRPALKYKLGGEWVEVSYQQLDRTGGGGGARAR